MGWKRDWNGEVTINRYSEEMLLQGIDDLLKRGFDLVSKGTYTKDKKHFDVKMNSIAKLNKSKFTDETTETKYWAKMRKVN